MVYMAEHGFKERVRMLERILLLRHRLAAKMGFESFAHMSMLGKSPVSRVTLRHSV
jgi:Zn-dependent oligopeptidase